MTKKDETGDTNTVRILKEDSLFPDLFRGLKALSGLSFPKTCSVCGRGYKDLEEFVCRTRSLRKSTGLKQELDDDGNPIVELFRNCICGSTLMDEFSDRRDSSEKGIQRREKFEEILQRLTRAGYSREIARQELLNIVSGRGSKLLRPRLDPYTE